MEAFERVRLPGEQLLWEGRPYTGLIFRPGDVFLVPFSLLWAGFAVFWNVMVWSSGAPIEMRLFGIPFLIAGAYVTLGRFLIDMVLRQKIRYAVTNKRILITRGLGSLRSVDIERLPMLDLDQREDGSGTLRFGAGGNWFRADNFGIWQPAFDTTPQFLRIPNARAVYELIDRVGRGEAVGG